MIESQNFKEEKRSRLSVFKCRSNYYLLLSSFVIQLILVNKLLDLEKTANVLVIIFYVLSLFIVVQLIYIFDGKVKFTINKNYLNFEYAFLWLTFERKYCLAKISNLSIEKEDSYFFLSLNGIRINKEISILKFTYEGRTISTGRLISEKGVYEIHQIILNYLKYSNIESKL